HQARARGLQGRGAGAARSRRRAREGRHADLVERGRACASRAAHSARRHLGAAAALCSRRADPDRARPSGLRSDRVVFLVGTGRAGARDRRQPQSRDRPGCRASAGEAPDRAGCDRDQDHGPGRADPSHAGRNRPLDPADPRYDGRQGPLRNKELPMIRPRLRNIALAVLLAVPLIPAAAAAQAVPDYAAIIAAPDRSDADRETDKRRDPVKLLAFTGVRPGMKVLDMGAGGGYSTELMARGVGPNGVVYGQNSAALARPLERFDARMKTPAMKNVVRTVRPFDDPLPADVHDLDLITFFFFYHDTTYMEVDRAAMNRKLHAALKPGGLLIIADHSAKPGDGTSVGKTLHRIEESVRPGEFASAASNLAAEADSLRPPQDTRDFPTARPPTPVDEFVLKYQK